jgi:hypothetical protein
MNLFALKRRLRIGLFYLVILALIDLGLGMSVFAATPRFMDNGNGTITDSKSGFQWTKEDSWSQTGKCLNWDDAMAYVKSLKTGGHTDWRVPTLDEISKWPNGIVERSKTNKTGTEFRNWKEEYTLNLDSIFAEGAAYWVWSSEVDGEKRAGAIDMRVGHILNLEKKMCFALGVRAVRNPEK